MKFLSPDSGFMRGLSDAVDAIWINILMLVTSIPIITIGAALTAGHDAVRRTLSGEGTATRNYFKAFRSNFAKSTGYWLISARPARCASTRGSCCRSRRCSFRNSR